MLRRLTMGVGVILLLALAGLASMIRIVPGAPTAPVAQPAVQHAEAPEPAPAGNWTHPLLAVPVQGVSRAQIVDTWGQSRANGARAHQATDIMAPGGTPVLAAAAGTVEKLFYSQGGGGITLYVRSPDRLWSYYYAHLQRYAPGVVEGMQVRVGDLLGFVGDTGNSGTGNFHLHFALSRMQPDDGWWKGQPVNPYPLLAGRR
jgi:murein DD-endopeptidase MepM/ murein hydrolase activator NlpD